MSHIRIRKLECRFFSLLRTAKLKKRKPHATAEVSV